MNVTLPSSGYTRHRVYFAQQENPGDNTSRQDKNKARHRLSEHSLPIVSKKKYLGWILSTLLLLPVVAVYKIPYLKMLLGLALPAKTSPYTPETPFTKALEAQEIAAAEASEPESVQSEVTNTPTPLPDPSPVVVQAKKEPKAVGRIKTKVGIVDLPAAFVTDDRRVVWKDEVIGSFDEHGNAYPATLKDEERKPEKRIGYASTDCKCTVTDTTPQIGDINLYIAFYKSMGEYFGHIRKSDNKIVIDHPNLGETGFVRAKKLTPQEKGAATIVLSYYVWTQQFRPQK